MTLRLALLALAITQVLPFADSAGRVWIEGGSNVKDWSCQATAFDAQVDSTGQHVIVRVLVRDLKCGNRRMDRDLYAALKASDPASPSSIVAAFSAPAAASDSGSEAPGTLTVAGVERQVTANISMLPGADGVVRVRGSLPLRMTDFGVKPPVGLFGLIRSKNDVVVRFDLAIKPAESGSRK